MVQSNEEKLSKAEEVICHPSSNNIASSFINENFLQQILINEGFKVYHTKHLDQENKDGLFFNLKELVEKLRTLILAVYNAYEHPRSFATNLIVMAYNQAFFAEHLPSLTDINVSSDTAIFSFIWPYTKSN